MVVDKREGMDQLENDLDFLRKNDLRFGWLTSPDAFSKGAGTGGDQKKDDDGTQEPATVAQVARAHELSLGNLASVQPPRSVLNSTTDEHTVEIEEGIGDFIGPVIQGDIEARDGLALLGELVVDLAKKRYVSQEGWKVLSDRRKKEKVRAGKRGDQARINWGQELNSLRYQIGGN